MRTQIDHAKAAPGGMKALFDLEHYVRTCGLEPPLLELVRLRASYMNGCAYCVDMHTKDARLAGETEQRLFAIPVWRETPFFTPRERAALAWTEAVTDVGGTGVPDEVFEEVRRHFSEEDVVNLTFAAIAINSWNRLSVSFRVEPGTYQPRAAAASRGSA